MTRRKTSRDEPQIDLAKLDYPSDTMTLKDLRHLFPKGFEGDEWTRESVPFFKTDISDRFSTMLMFERILATYAFDEALGRSLEERAFTSRKDVRRYVKDQYTAFGLATGPQNANELIRILENSAAEQARGHNPGHQR